MARTFRLSPWPLCKDWAEAWDPDRPVNFVPMKLPEALAWSRSTAPRWYRRWCDRKFSTMVERMVRENPEDAPAGIFKRDASLTWF